MPHDLHRLSFTLPQALRLGVIFGRHTPCLHTCLLFVGTDYRVAIQGKYRESVLEQARRFLRVHARGHGALSIAAVLTTPATHPTERTGSDTVMIVVNSRISFSFTPIVPDIDPAADVAAIAREERPRPSLAIVGR